MPAIVNKSNITKVCVDDFAFRKRYTYGTVMVDLGTHRIIDLLDSRETGKVEEWLKSYSNLQVISRDGAQTYASAAKNSHPEASLRVFMQKERTHQKSVAQMEKETLEYISRKTMCQLIYHELENIKGITSEQYDAVIKKYPILGQLYSLLKEFHRIVFSQKSDELDDCIETAAKLNIDELDSYLGGIHNDIQAVKNAINYKYNNGLAEGSVNKIKLIKRIMYGRNSFTLLKAKILLNESLFYQIN